MLTRFEWSVMAMYLRPRSCAAATISASVALPSLAVVCMCRSPARSLRSMRTGSLPAAAQANSSRASRISGGKQRQVHRRVDVRLCLAGNVFAFVILFRLLADAEHAVLVDLQPAIFRHAAEDHVMVFRAREVLQRRAERLGRHDAQVDLQPAREPDRELRVAAADHRIDVAELEQVIHHGVGIFGFDQEIEIADRFFAAPVAAGDFDLPDAFELPHVNEQFVDDRIGFGPVHAFVRVGGEIDSGEDLLLRLCAEALESADLVRLACGPQHVERVDLELLVERGRLLGPQARYPQQGHHARRHRARSSSSIESLPVLTSSAIFSARSLPMPSMSVRSCELLTSCSSD